MVVNFNNALSCKSAYCGVKFVLIKTPSQSLIQLKMQYYLILDQQQMHFDIDT